LRKGGKADEDKAIPKPKGTIGSKGYQLQVEMKLVNDKELYKSILVSGCSCKKMHAHLFDSKLFMTQQLKLGLISQLHTISSRCGDWESCSLL